MRCRLAPFIGASLFLCLAGVTPASAALITYDLSMMATTDNVNYTPVFGLPTEFGGPFTGSLTVDYAMLPGGTPQASVTDFAMTIGTKTWNTADVHQVSISADAGGVITNLFFRADDNHDPTPGVFGNVFEMFVDFGNAPPFWRAFNTNCLVGDDFVMGACIQGIGARDTVIAPDRTAAPVPEPASLLLTGVGLGLVARLGRRRRQSVG